MKRVLAMLEERGSRGSRHPAFTVGKEIANRHSSDDDGTRFEAIAREPTPEEAAVAEETLEELMRRMPSDRGRKILMHRLQDHTEAEIGKLVGCSERTVRRFVSEAKRLLQLMLAER